LDAVIDGGRLELQFVRLTEALALTLLLVDGELAKYERAALRWHLRFVYESKNVDIRESQAVLVLLAAIPANRLAASAVAELLSRRRGLEQVCEVLVVAWARRKRSVGGGGTTGFSEITQRSWALERVFPSFGHSS
jgi:hypothetical protein